ncbi:MAG: hypothetical protein CM15mP42_10920 [Methanobacteriota archaeon]|nr:MAG: hypothetical protein CM15mP42_10920 [Euryarchaeota archaeon]
MLETILIIFVSFLIGLISGYWTCYNHFELSEFTTNKH